ncbi:hypothetical protein pipiens_006618 [Culex pipiens pipiens]|uniref:C2H2-type domain-containing protein n=1 Tax=Culex pipiens pipiens TaxID=38569 RepID=A0ABD1DR58_CULPP
MHEKIREYECHLCHKNFSSLNTVHTHIRTMHSNIEYNFTHPSCPCATTRRSQNYQTTQKWTKNYTVLEPKPGVKESAQHMKLCNICGAVVQQACTHLSNTNFPKEFCCTLCEAVFKHRETRRIPNARSSPAKHLLLSTHFVEDQVAGDGMDEHLHLNLGCSMGGRR